MKRPVFTDRRGRYRSSAESREPGYLARRFKAIERLQRMRKRATVTTLRGRNERDRSAG
jgi:hypothetical protein